MQKDSANRTKENFKQIQIDIEELIEELNNEEIWISPLERTFDYSATLFSNWSNGVLNLQKEYVESLEIQMQEQLDITNNEESSLQDRARAWKKYYDTVELYGKAKDKLDKVRLKGEQTTFKASAQILSDAAGLAGEGTVASKALGIASATISSYTAGAQVLADPTLPFYAKIAAMAAVVSSGLLQVKNILSVKIPNANDTTSAPDSVSLPNMPDLMEPIVETHNNQTAYDEDLINQSRTVLVVEDLNTVNDNYKVAVQESTF